MKIFIDAGHNYNGFDTGASGYGLKEQDVTYRIASGLFGLLASKGYDVKLSREKITDNLGDSLSESLKCRTNMANRWGADLFISIHCNAGGGKGTETIIYTYNSPSRDIASKIQLGIVKRLQTKNRGLKFNPNLHVLKHTNMQAILVETAFIDNIDDNQKLKERVNDFAQAIFEAITGVESVNETKEKTVYEINDTIVQEIFPYDFGIYQCNKAKKDVGIANYFNLGYFTALENGDTIPVGNLAINGKIIANAKDNPKWINLSEHSLTTIYTTNQGGVAMTETDDLNSVYELKNAISGIPIIRNGRRIPIEEIKAQGYFGNELYDTWHGFLGIRNHKLVYVAKKCSFNSMCWLMVALGIYDAIKLDGGGSFILHNGETIAETGENRKINNVGMWNL